MKRWMSAEKSLSSLGPPALVAMAIGREATG